VTRILAWLAAHDRALGRWERALAVAIPVVFLGLAIVRAWPFVDDVPLDRFVGDDWWTYKTYGHTILREGLAMPSVGPYVAKVHGFLYSYFVAGVFAIFGENTAFVYILQSFMVGASVSLLYLPLRERLSHAGAIGFLVAASVLMYIDFFRSLSFLLLSESLYVFLLSVFLVAYLAAFKRGSHVTAFVAGIVLGLAVLSRTSALAAAFGVLGAGVAYVLLRRGSARPTVALALAAGFAASMGLLPLREYAATGRAEFDLITHTADWIKPPTEPLAFAEFFARRVLFTLGFTSFLTDEYRFRPHWFLIWIGFFGWAVSRFWWRRAPDFREVATVVFLALYFGPIIFFADPVNYGGRYISVGLPFALMLATAVVDDLLFPSLGRSRGDRSARVVVRPAST